jgi:hypothetical protein
MPSDPPIGSVAPIDDGSWALVTRMRSGTYTQDTTDAAVEALARVGVGTFAGPAATGPIIPIAGVTSPMRVLDWQAHALAVQAWAGSAVSGRELDDALALPREMQDGRPLASQLLAGYVATVDSPGGATSRALMAGQDLLDTPNLRFPSLVMVFFLSDLATDGGTRPPAEAAVTAAAFTPVVRTAALGSICSDAANWVTNTIHRLFAAVKLATPANLPGAILVSIWNWLVSKAEAFVNRLIGALTDAVLAQVRFIAGSISALVQRVASFLPYGVEVRTEPRQIFVLPPSGPSPSGVLIATVSAGDLPDWPDVLKDCAGVAKVPLPDFRPADVPVVWGKPHGDGTRFVVPGTGSPATDPNGEARWEFGTLPDGAPGGDPVDALMYQDVKVRRPEVAEARAALTSGLLGGLPPLISDLVGRLLAPFMDAVFSRLDKLVETTGQGVALIVYHKPPEPTPRASVSACSAGIPPGEYDGTLAYASTGPNLTHDGSGKLRFKVDAKGAVTGSWDLAYVAEVHGEEGTGAVTDGAVRGKPGQLQLSGTNVVATSHGTGTSVPWPETPLAVRPLCEGHVVAKWEGRTLDAVQQVTVDARPVRSP